MAWDKEHPRCLPSAARERAGLTFETPDDLIPERAFYCPNKATCQDIGACAIACGVLKARPLPPDVRPAVLEGPAGAIVVGLPIEEVETTYRDDEGELAA